MSGFSSPFLYQITVSNLAKKFRMAIIQLSADYAQLFFSTSEVSMKYLIPMACLIFFSISTTSYALTVQPEGHDQRVEWKVVQSWPTESKTLDMVYSLDGKYVYILNDRQQVQIFNRAGNLQGSIPIEKGVSTIDISPQGDLLYLVNNVKNTFSSLSVSFVVEVETADSPFEGPADAPVTLAVFTDFE